VAGEVLQRLWCGDPRSAAAAVRGPLADQRRDRARIAIFLGRLDTADAELQRLEAASVPPEHPAEPDAAETVALRASWWRARGQPERAVRAADEALAVAPTHAALLAEAAEARLEVGALAAAAALDTAARAEGAGTNLDRLRFARLIAAGAMGAARARAEGAAGLRAVQQAAATAGQAHVAALAGIALARTLTSQGHASAARALHQQAARDCLAQGHPLGAAAAVGGLGAVAMATGAWSEAVPPLRRAVDLATRAQSPGAELAWREALDTTLDALGRTEWRVRELEQSIALAESLDRPTLALRQRRAEGAEAVSDLPLARALWEDLAARAPQGSELAVHALLGALRVAARQGEDVTARIDALAEPLASDARRELSRAPGS
jgi:tetratricopeptide (TPR) repeat protein